MRQSRLDEIFINLFLDQKENIHVICAHTVSDKKGLIQLSRHGSGKPLAYDFLSAGGITLLLFYSGWQIDSGP